MVCLDAIFGALLLFFSLSDAEVLLLCRFPRVWRRDAGGLGAEEPKGCEERDD